jgi:hypothetical protein
MSSMYDRTYLIHNAGVKDASKAKMVEVLKRLILYVDGHGGVQHVGATDKFRTTNPTIPDDITFLYGLSCEALGVEPHFAQELGANKAAVPVNGAPPKLVEATNEVERAGA